MATLVKVAFGTAAATVAYHTITATFSFGDALAAISRLPIAG